MISPRESSVSIAENGASPAVAVHQVCVLMLTMNEEAAVSQQIEEIRKQAGSDIPILIVDSSSDRTADVAARLNAKVVRQFPPRGYGKAMLIGQQEAAKLADIIVTMDCDMSYPAGRIAEFVQLIEQGYDCVSGSRMSGPNQGMPLLNQTANRFFAFLVRWLFGYKVTDLTTGMRAYRSSVITSIEWVPLRFFPAEQGLRLHQAGCKVVEVPIEYQLRVGDVKMRKVRDTIALLQAIYHCWRTPVRRKSLT
jgi:glycosyltransferase involved in cell wall biosynthesis